MYFICILIQNYTKKIASKCLDSSLRYHEIIYKDEMVAIDSRLYIYVCVCVYIYKYYEMFLNRVNGSSKNRYFKLQAVKNDFHC